MAQPSITQPVLAAKPPRDPREPILDTLAEMDEQIELLRKRKAGAAVVESAAVDNLHFLLKRARGDIRRLHMGGAICSKAKVIRLGVENASAIQQAARIEECLDNFAAIIPLLDENYDGDKPAIMAYLITDLRRNFQQLDGLLAMRSTTVAS